MLFATRDVIKWIGFSSFEICMQTFALLICSILIMLKVEGVSLSWWQVFSPMFVADGLTLYFSFIVFLRTIHKGQKKKAFRRGIWVLVVLILLFSFKMPLCQMLENSLHTRTTYVMTPLFILWPLLLVRACRVK